MIFTIIVLTLVALCLLMPIFGIPVSPTRRQGLSTLFFIIALALVVISIVFSGPW